MAGTVHGDTGRCVSKCAFPHLPIDFFATKMLIWRGFVHQPARAFGGPQRGRNQRLCTMGSQRLAAASPTVNQYDKGACEMVWERLVKMRFCPEIGSTSFSKDSADFGDPLGLALGLPAEYAQLTNKWQQMRPREWTNVGQVWDDLSALSYKSRSLLLTWWLCQRLAMEKPWGEDQYMENPANMRDGSPVDDWLGWANAALQKELPTCDSATKALKQPVALAFKKCVADGTHDTMDLLLQRLGMNWGALTPDDFPCVAHSTEHEQRRSPDKATNANSPTLYAKPLSEADADSLQQQWQKWVQAPFPGWKPLTKDGKNVHLSWADNDATNDTHPFAALLSVFRAHKAPVVEAGGAKWEMPVVNHPLSTVWLGKSPLPASTTAKVWGFPKASLGAWLARSKKSDPKITTSFQDGWTFGKSNKKPPLLSYLLAWAASQHIERTCPDWLNQIDQPRPCSLSTGKQANT